MKTIISIITSLLFVMNLCAQDFTRFDESELKWSSSFLSIVLKGQKEPLIHGGLIVDKGRAFMEHATHDFFEIFKHVEPEDEMRFDRIQIKLHVADTLLNTDYVEFRFMKKDRDYVLRNEELFYRFAKSLENMEAYREYVYFAEGHTTGSIYIPIKSFFKIKAGNFWK